MADAEDQQSPFTRPGFIAAAGVIAVVVVLGIVLAVANSRDSDPSPPPAAGPASTSATAATSAPATEGEGEGEASVCGLKGEVLAGTVTTAPEATWEYQGTIGYPTSNTYGPGERTPENVRYCFQHSPTGALFMAANAAAQGSDPATSAQWASRALADGRYHDELLGRLGGGSSSEGTRLTIAGFRILSYDGTTARVDLGTEVSSGGQNITMSAVYELVWQSGDWKISSDVQTPLDAAEVPDLAGYIPWGV